MREPQVLITGASGCVGQYTCNWLLKNTNSSLILLLRDPKKLTSINHKDQRVKLLIGDLRNIQNFSNDLLEVTHVIHTATAWGDIERTNQVNIIAVKRLLSHLNQNTLVKFIYFSTASILNKNLELIPEAINYGTEYIQTKAKCLIELEKHPLSNKIIAVFPTLVFGGKYDNSDIFPSSYLTQGLKEAMRWIWLARWFKGFSKFHFIHAEDIAIICGKLLLEENLPPSSNQKEQSPKYVLGQPFITIDEAIGSLRRWKGLRNVPSIPLWGWLIKVLVKILPIKISSWDNFIIKQRDFIHEPVTSPEDFGSKSSAKTLNEVLLLSGLPKAKKPSKKVLYKKK